MEPVQERSTYPQEIRPPIPGKRARVVEENSNEYGILEGRRTKRRGDLSSAASDLVAKISGHTPGTFPYGDFKVSALLLKILPLDYKLEDDARRLADIVRAQWGNLGEGARLAMLKQALQQQDEDVLCSIVNEDMHAPEPVRHLVQQQSRLVVELARRHGPESYHLLLFLIRNGADIEGHDAFSDKNALFWACAYGNYDLIKELLLRGTREAQAQIQHIWDDTAVRHTLGMVAEAAHIYSTLYSHLQRTIGSTWLLALRCISGHMEQHQFALKLLEASRANDRATIKEMAQEAESRGLVGMICPGVGDKHVHQYLRELPHQGAPGCLIQMLHAGRMQMVPCPIEHAVHTLVSRALQRHDIDLLASLVKADMCIPDTMRECVQKSGRLLVEMARWHMPELAHVTAFLIRNGVDIEAYDTFYDKNALFWACTYGNIGLIKELLSRSLQATRAQLDQIWQDKAARHVLGMVAEGARSDNAFRQSLQEKIGDTALAELGALTGHWEQSQRALALLAAVQTEDARTIESMLPEAVARGLSGLIRHYVEAAAQEIGGRLELRDI